ncbi:vanadium-dependent haloperoxidase [Flavisolibacter ginsenosidimutans]|uniref:Vanadium-dependent haloperoxidase n=1 Tax=Flavisolibacter ginsenosidimutans TaxID=661481 RepID=A0A5B8UGV4_9BACT|nr:vanadium-dependent haloperoxidase [Flavisolibacter ginsenosidimutans]QEC55320.1 vanadium-dependent haloperoxidase [Flavisolibacter ginsenosidimutans]
MKIQMKAVLMLMTAFAVLNSGCKKNGITNSSFDEPVTDAFSADVQNAPLIKFGADVPAKWYALAINLSRTTPNQSPGPINSRAFGYMGLALYESVMPGIPGDKSMQSQLNEMPALPQVVHGEKYFYPSCANAALANMVHHMFGNTSSAQNFTIDSLEASLNTLFASMVSKDVLDRSLKFGRDISNAIYSWSVSDGGDKAYLNPFPSTYVPPVGPGLWVPQPGQLAQLPSWGNNRTFIKNNAASTQPPPPPAYSTESSSKFYQEELAVYHESINQNPEHIIIAKYWAALPGPSVSISVLSSVLASKNSNLAVAAEAYCKVGIAIADAIVSCYKTKYQYNQERPITFIRANFNSTWVPTLPTPPFPDYTSAHSVQAGASARVLADIFGNNTTFTDNTINSLGFTPRIFTKFSDFANELALSRFYAGIHVLTSNLVGLDQGNLVGMHVSALKFKND